MALRNIVLEGDEILKKRAREVTEINDHVISILDDMIETMRDQEGVGIAAPQVGVLRRIIVVETEEDYVEIINPEILESSGSQHSDEACLSVPGIIGMVERPDYIKVKGLNRKGEEFEVEARDFYARALCHEIDHLNGVLFVDKAVDIRSADAEEN